MYWMYPSFYRAGASTKQVHLAVPPLIRSLRAPPPQHILFVQPELPIGRVLASVYFAHCSDLGRRELLINLIHPIASSTPASQKGTRAAPSTYLAGPIPRVAIAPFSGTHPCIQRLVSRLLFHRKVSSCLEPAASLRVVLVLICPATSSAQLLAFKSTHIANSQATPPAPLTLASPCSPAPGFVLSYHHTPQARRCTFTSPSHQSPLDSSCAPRRGKFSRALPPAFLDASSADTIEKIYHHG